MICKIMTIPKKLSTEIDVLFSKLKYILIFIGKYHISLVEYRGPTPLRDFTDQIGSLFSPSGSRTHQDYLVGVNLCTQGLPSSNVL